jgi:hypothetical protein
MSGPPATLNAWRPTDLEAIRRALLIPVTAPALRAINDAMAQLERSYPEAILAAKGSLDAIAVIDTGLAAGGPPPNRSSSRPPARRPPVRCQRSCPRRSSM